MRIISNSPSFEHGGFAGVLPASAALVLRQAEIIIGWTVVLVLRNRDLRGSGPIACLTVIDGSNQAVDWQTAGLLGLRVRVADHQ
jgi:hypothetical protein